MFATEAVNYNPFVLYASTSNPAVVASAGQFFTKTTGGGVVEAFYEDSAGGITQITSGGALNGGDILVPIVDTSTTAYHNVLTLGNRQSLTWEGNDSTGLRNGTNAQTLSVYNTYTAGTPDYERLEMFWSSNVAVIRTAANGTGAARNLGIRYGNVSASTAITIGTVPNGGLVLGDGSSSAQSSGNVILGGNSGSFSATSSTNSIVLFNGGFSDGGTNSTTISNAFHIAPSVNYTGATRTGKVNLIYLAPTLTSLPTGNNGGIVFSSAFTNSSFPAMRFYNTADEVTDTEYLDMGWHVTTNRFTIRTMTSGSGSVRPLQFCVTGGTAQAIVIPTGISSPVEIMASQSSSSSGPMSMRVGNGFTFVGTTGTGTGVAIVNHFSPSATSAMANFALHVNPTINYSNGTPGAGYVYGINIAPVNTALPTGQSAALHFSSTASALGGAVWDNQTDEQTNYEKVTARFASNIWSISATAGGSGTLRGLRFGATGNSISFYGATPVALQTGVAVSAAGIHAALVNLGLITA